MLIAIVIILILGLAYLVYRFYYKHNDVTDIILAIIFTLMLCLCFHYIHQKIYPTPLDVYRNRTLLQVGIKLIDGKTTVVDSVVIFKARQ